LKKIARISIGNPWQRNPNTPHVGNDLSFRFQGRAEEVDSSLDLIVNVHQPVERQRRFIVYAVTMLPIQPYPTFDNKVAIGQRVVREVAERYLDLVAEEGSVNRADIREYDQKVQDYILEHIRLPPKN